MKSIGVLGAGTWGIALARLLANKGHDVVVWSALPQEIDTLRSAHKHPNLPEMILPDSLGYTKSLEEACTGKDMLLFAVPSVFVRSTAEKAKPFIADGQIIVNAGKGIEHTSNMTLTEVIDDVMRSGNDSRTIRLVALSGPTHAEEVALDMPTAIVSASADQEAACMVQDIFMSPNFRVYINQDIKGIEICGALKNIIALASGMTAGLGYGDNAKAALITRGLTEIKRLGLNLGCHNDTFSGLAGMGDLVVTCTSEHSRNNHCGYLIGKGYSADDAIKEVGMVVEGINVLNTAMELAQQNNIEMPITEAVYKVVREGMDPRQMVDHLMQRDKKSEI